ncbi:uncharacterized protein [Dermacentor albipictus]|uniref:uncharacterized protein n=1 Tax=Dermacentor albipictus TaxID=60249 RepID=UPI0038FC6686
MLIMFDKSASSEAKAGEGGDGGDDGSGSGTFSGGGGGGGRKKSKTTQATTPSTTTKTTPVPTKRPAAFIFCTVGPFSESGSYDVLQGQFCDYFVYTHVLPYQRDILSYDNHQSWEQFKKSAAAYRNKLDYFGFPNVTNTSTVKLQHYGYSFAAYDISWLKSHLDSVAAKVKQLYKDNGLLTAGLAYYSRPDAATDHNLGTIKSIMTSINGMLDGAQDKNTTNLKTTFLAVKLSGKDSSAKNDASALQELKGVAHMDLLILLTHLVDVPSHPNCKILPLSRYAADALDPVEPPSMERLLNSIDKLKDAKFRVAFSTSFAVYLFKPLGGLQDTTKFGDKCMHSFFDDMSALCDVPDASIIEDKKNPAVSTATYSNKQSGIFMVFETNNATRVKVSQALVKAREKGVMLTWAVYEVHRDQMLCENKKKTLERLATVNDSMVTIFFPPQDDR